MSLVNVTGARGTACAPWAGDCRHAVSASEHERTAPARKPKAMRRSYPRGSRRIKARDVDDRLDLIDNINVEGKIVTCGGVSLYRTMRKGLFCLVVASWIASAAWSVPQASSLQNTAASSSTESTAVYREA